MSRPPQCYKNHPAPAPIHPVELFEGRVSINWDYLIERRPLVLEIHEDLPAYLLLPEINQLLDVTTHARTHLLFNILWHTGARISEALALTPESFTLRDEWSSCVVLDTLKQRGRPKKGRKNTKKRMVPITDLVFLREIKSYLETHACKPGERLFSFTPQWAGKLLNKSTALLHAPLSMKISPHTFRHSFACNAILHGEPLTVVRDWLGHSHVDTTEIYTAILSSETNHLMRYMRFS
jgi:site-specific recombinase XerD